jgi:hypothetical protein
MADGARADLCRRLGRTAGEARASYEAALTQARQEPERRFLERRLSLSEAKSGPKLIRAERRSVNEVWQELGELV